MPWGKHKGEKLADIPAGYFLWWMEQPFLKDWPQLQGYIEANADAIYKEREEEDDDGLGFSNYQDFLDNR